MNMNMKQLDLGGEPKTVPTKIPPTEEQLKEFLGESVL
jgi:hypothetical protein